MIVTLLTDYDRDDAPQTLALDDGSELRLAPR